MLRKSGWVPLAAAWLAAAASGQSSRPVSEALPSWLKVGAELRGRAEGFTGLDYVPDNNDYYYLHRLRLNATVEPLPWLRLFAQAQDAQAPGFRIRPQPSSVANTLDLRQAHLELGVADKAGWSLRAGRQEFIFGEERLVGGGNWGNVARSFDAARLTWRRPGARLDWFASAVVVPVNGRFDHPVTNNKFHGFYSSFDRLIQKSTLEPFFFWKTNSRVRSERGLAGDLDVLTGGLRALGKLPRGFDYNVEMAWQGGHAAGDDIRAWAGHWLLGYTLPLKDRAPRLIAEYNYGSGDPDPRDGRRGTFDQLFPTNHSKYGTADRIAWRNIHDLAGGVGWKPSAKWAISVDYHAFWLATRQDALYTEGGVAFVRNPAATSSHIGDEIDFQANWQFSERLQFGFGYAHLFPGAFLEQSSAGSPVSAPYVMWSYRF